jgi:hypothetical protein
MKGKWFSAAHRGAVRESWMDQGASKQLGNIASSP